MSEVKLGMTLNESGPRFVRMSASEYRERMLRGELVGQAPERGLSGRGRPHGGVVRRDYEEDLQKACFDWVFAHERRYPALRWVFHSPNGGQRTKAQAGRFKAMGVRAGVVDILSSFPSASAAGLACELKSPGKGPTADQLAYLQCAHQAGYVTGLCTSLDEFIVRAQCYLGLCELPDRGANWQRWCK